MWPVGLPGSAHRVRRSMLLILCGAGFAEPCEGYVYAKVNGNPLLTCRCLVIVSSVRVLMSRELWRAQYIHCKLALATRNVDDHGQSVGVSQTA
jgi:hypothetical protein